MDKNKSKKTEDESSSDSSYESSSEDEKEFKKKFIPAHIRLREAIKQKKDERKKGTIKYKENFDE